MQDEIIPPFCRFDSAKVLTDTVSVSTRGNVTDILSATLRTISPFALVCVILPLTRIRTSKCRSDWWRSKCPAPAERGDGIFRCHLNGNVTEILTTTLAKIRITFLIFSGIIVLGEALPPFWLYSFTTNDQPLCYIWVAFLNYPL